MITISKEELKLILENHKHWLNEDIKGCEDMRANLSNADLRNANLSNAYLSYAKLRNADLRNAYLSNADLSNAYLSYADLSNADLSNANLSNANLRNANLSNAKNIAYIPMVCPEEGSFIGWKKAGNRIVKLQIPKDALRSSATSRKCRCNKAKVLEIYNFDGSIALEREIKSGYDENFVYKVGKFVEVNDFDYNRWNECTSGIHFFMQRQEAIYY